MSHHTMTGQAQDAVDEFVADTRAAFESHTDALEQAQLVTEATQRLVQKDGWMEEMVDFDGRRARADLHIDEELGHPKPGFAVKASVTHPNEPTGGSTPHDHGSAFVVYGVYRGEMEQYRYNWQYDDEARNPRLKQQTKYVQEPGEALFLLPGEIHRTNIVSDEPTWVVRIESQHVSSIDRHRYDLDANRIHLG